MTGCPHRVALHRAGQGSPELVEGPTQNGFVESFNPRGRVRPLAGNNSQNGSKYASLVFRIQIALRFMCMGVPMTKRTILSVAVLAATFGQSTAMADEKIRYKYDALGRLERVIDDSGPNAGVNSIFDYDKASNRSRFRVQTGQPNNANRPPVANADTLPVQCRRSGSIDVIANDTDPDNDSPLTLVSLTKVSGSYTINASISGSRTVSASVGSNPGDQAQYDYIIRDPAGATATGRLTIYTYGSPMLCA